VAHAEWCDLNFQKNVLHVEPKPGRGWKVKDREDRLMPIPASLMAKLKARQGKAQSHDLIFPAKNGGVQGHLIPILQNFVEDNARSIRRSKRLRRLSPTQATMRMIRNVQPALNYDPCDRNHSSSVVNTL
jgi:integrase